MRGFKPLADRVLIERLEAESKTSGGIVLPDTAKEKPRKGVVRAVGPGKMHEGDRIPMQVKVSDEVLFANYAGSEIRLDNKDFVIMNETDILAILE